MFDTEIPHAVRAAECALSGESIFSHDKNGKVAAAYEMLTKEVAEIERKSIDRPWISKKSPSVSAPPMVCAGARPSA